MWSYVEIFDAVVFFHIACAFIDIDNLAMVLSYAEIN
jgi:hypothetical protein